MIYESKGQGEREWERNNPDAMLPELVALLDARSPGYIVHLGGSTPDSLRRMWRRQVEPPKCTAHIAVRSTRLHSLQHWDCTLPAGHSGEHAHRDQFHWQAS